MKKLTIFLVMAALAIPAMQAKDKADSKRFNRSSKSIPTSVLVQNDSWGSQIVNTKGEVMFWDFEDEAQIADWTFIDYDGDGYNWQYFNYSDGVTPHMTPYEGYGNMSSASFVNNDAGGGTALTPDNWMISPQVELGGLLSFYAAGQDASYAAEVFAVYVCEGVPNSIEDFVKISDDITATGDYVKYEFILKQYAGKTGCFAIRHYNVTDMFWLNIDNITLDPNYVVLDAPINLVADPAATTAEITWVDPNEGAATAWNLRYCVYDPNEVVESMTYDFDSALEPWTAVDADGDGYTWEIETNSTYGFIAAMSGSYISGVGALEPDNWLISPCFKLGGSIKFDVTNYSSYYPETFGIYVFEGDQWTNVADFVPVAENLQTTAYAYTGFETMEFDLGNYSGMGYVAIRNYGTYNEWKFYIDNVELTPGVDWIYKNGVTDNPYNLEGLTPETDYLLQVQAVAGRAVSPWSEPVIFTTLAESTTPTEQCAKPEGGFENGIDFHGVTVTLINNETAEGTELHYNITLNGELVVEDAIYDGEFALTEDGEYYIDFWATAPGMLDSSHGGLIFTIDAMTGLSELLEGKTVSSVRYFNVAGQEMAQPQGMTIVVTTYTDGTTSAAKVVK